MIIDPNTGEFVGDVALTPEQTVPHASTPARVNRRRKAQAGCTAPGAITCGSCRRDDVARDSPPVARAQHPAD